MLAVLTTIWLLHVAALVVPGANVLLVSQLAASDRQRTAVFAALGVSAGAFLWATLAVLGVDAAFEAFPRVRLLLQFAAGAYLLYLAVRIWSSPAPDQRIGAMSLSEWSAFRLGLLTNATNPKAALFYGSVFAAAFPAEPSALLQAVAVGMVVVNALCWHLFLAHAFSRDGVRARYARYRTLLNRFAGAILGAIGLRLLAASAAELGA